MTTTTKIGIIGTGAIGQAFAQQALRSGLEVLISNRRGPESLAALARQLGPGARAATVREAAAAPLVLLAVPWAAVEPALAGLPAWEGRVVIDATNAVLLPDFRAAPLGGKLSSQVVAALLPGARVVKAFNTLLASVLAAEPHQGGGRRVLFLSGDDAEARAEVTQLIEKLGFAAVDLGTLATAGALQQFPGGPLAALNLVKLG